MHRRARIAVIGTGWWSTYTHIPRLLERDDVDLVALCDQDPDRLRAAAAAFRVARTYADHAALLTEEELDGVVVATNHVSHYPLARAALGHGLHVLVEKPLTLHAAEARDLVDLSVDCGQSLIIGYPWNYTPQALRAHEILASEELGAVQLVMCHHSSHVLHFFRGDEQGAGDPSLFPVHGPGAVYSQPELSSGGQGHVQVTHAAGLLFFGEP